MLVGEEKAPGGLPFSSSRIWFGEEVHLEPSRLMRFTSLSKSFFMLSRLIVRFRRWVIARMPWNWRVRSSDGGLKGEPSGACGTGGVKIGVLWVLVILAGLLGFSCGHACCGFMKNRGCSGDLLEEKDRALLQRFSIGGSHLRSLASAFHIFDQVCFFHEHSSSSCPGRSRCFLHVKDVLRMGKLLPCY